MTTLKLVDAVRCFKGEDGEDLELWLDRFKVALDVTSKWPTSKDRDAEMARLMPLFLEGRAYTTWKQLSDVEKSDLETVKSALRRVYGVSKVAAWKRIKAIRLFPGDLVDVIADEICSLLRIVLEDEPPDPLVAITLIDALPSNIAEQVTLLHGEKMVLRDVISSAKSLQIGQKGVGAMAAAATTGARRQQGTTTSQQQPPARCYGCRRFGHLIRDCPLICYRCGGRGHYQRNCKVKIQGNESAGSTLPDQVVPASSH